MSGVERQRLLFALLLLVMALFVTSGYPPAARWRRSLRLAAIIGFGLALLAAIANIICWYFGSCR